MIGNCRARKFEIPILQNLDLKFFQPNGQRISVSLIARDDQMKPPLLEFDIRKYDAPLRFPSI